MVLVDGGGQGAEVPDVASEVMARQECGEEALGPNEEAVAGAALHAEQVEVDAVFGATSLPTPRSCRNSSPTSCSMLLTRLCAAPSIIDC